MFGPMAKKLLPLAVVGYGLIAPVAAGASVATCVVAGSNDPDAYVTGARGSDEGIGGTDDTNTGRYSSAADCGLGIGANDSGSIVDGFGGVEDWSFYGKYDKAGNAGSQDGWTVPGYSTASSGTWEIDSSAFDIGTLFMLILKDGPADGQPPNFSTQWTWFVIGPGDGSSTLSGDWFMWGNRNGNNRVENSHISLYTAAGGSPPASVPEPMSLTLFGIGLAGLIATRRKKLAA